MGKGSGGGGSVKVQISPLEQQMADIAQRQDSRAQNLEMNYLDPLREIVTPQIIGALQTNPFQTKLSAPERAVYEQQFNQARNNTLNTGARGGQLRQGLRGLERDRAGAIAAAANDAKQRGITRALGFTSGAVPTAAGTVSEALGGLSGMSAANSTASQRALSQAQMNAQNQSSKGSGIGSLLGAGAGYLMKSSRDFKTDIDPYNDDVLSQVDATPIYTWRYKGRETIHLGPVTEEAPKIIVSEDGKALVPINYLGFMFAAIKALNTKVAALEAR